MNYPLAQPRQEDVFKSISENVGGNSDPTMLYLVMAGAAVFILLMVLVNAMKKRQARPRAVNHQGRLLKDLLKRIPLKKGELKQLKVMAAEQGCESPLTLVLCPSVLARGLTEKGKADKKVVMAVARKMGVVRRKEA